MGNCCKKNTQLDPGSVLDQIISQASNENDCLLYKLASYKKGGELIDAYNIGGPSEVEKLIREQFGILMYKDGKGQIITRTEYLRWKFRNQTEVIIPVEPSSINDPLAKWEDHEGCWQMQYRGSLGESLLHLLIIIDSKIHTRLAKILLKCYPKLATDIIEGEEYYGASALHLAIAYMNNDMVNLLVDCGAQIDRRATGSFFLPRDQQRLRPSKETDYEGLAYLGEYPLSWSACVNNESVYNLLLEKGADPDDQDSFGNTVLHMVVITDQLGMYGFALRHPKVAANNEIQNNQELTPLTLACQMGRASVFREMLELSSREFWRYSNITCSGYPLNALDTIMPSGKTNWQSALFMILEGSKEDHLNMLEGGIIQRLLEEKWKTFAQNQFLKRITIAFLHLISMSIAIYLRPTDRTQSLNDYSRPSDIVRLGFELCTIFGCIIYVFVQQGGELMNQGLFTFIRQLPNSPPKIVFLIANFLILFCIPLRFMEDLKTEEKLLAFVMVFSWFFMMFFAGAIKLTGPFVTMIYSMITGDMLTFGIIYTIFLFAFSQSFFYIYKSHPTANETLFTNFPLTWMSLYQMTLGSYNYQELSQTGYPNLAKTVFILFMILVPILLLNMLIAMMGNTYSQVIERSEKEWVKQWAKLVVALERAVSEEDAKKYIEDYSIKLSGTTPENEIRGVMVIKSKSKTKASQRKGALANWKRVGKVTIKALKKRGMTGEEMRILMWHSRDSITPPTKATKAPGMQVPGVPGIEGQIAGEVKSPNIFGLMDDTMTQMTYSVDGQLPLPPSTLNPSGTTITTLESAEKPLEKFENSYQQQSLTMSMTSPVVTDVGNTLDLVLRDTDISRSPTPGLIVSQQPKIKKRKIGVCPKIVIFSDRKDMIRVGDSDDSDNDLLEPSFGANSRNYNVDVDTSSKKHSQQQLEAPKANPGKAGRRKSISSDLQVISGSLENLCEKDQLSISVDKKIIGEAGVVNPAFEPDEKETAVSKPEKISKSKVRIQDEEKEIEKEKVKEEEEEKKKERPKSGKKGPTPSSSSSTSTKGKDVEFEKDGKDGKKRPSTSTNGRGKSGKGGRNKSKVGHENDEPESEEEIKERPTTANMDRWSTKDISSMSKLVAWERSDDEM